MRLKVCFAVLAMAAVPNAPVAHAGPPPNFPDLADFSVVTGSHLATYRHTTLQVVKFSTPDGMYCHIDALGGIGATVRCYGPVPGTAGLVAVADPDAKMRCDFGLAQLRAANEGTVSSYRGDCPADLSGAALLAPGEKVSLGTATCGVAPGAVTACIDSTDGGHGFVLQPSGSWTF